MNHGPALLLSVLTHGRVVLLAVTASWGSRWAKLRGRKDPRGVLGASQVLYSPCTTCPCWVCFEANA